MSTLTVAKKDVRDGIHSKLLWLLTALFVISIAGFSLYAALLGSGAEGGDDIGAALGVSFVFAVLFLIPLTGLVVSIKSIVREREAGSLKLLLSLPHTRKEVVLGKFLGRTGLFSAALLAGFLPATFFFALGVDGFPVAEFLSLTVVMVLFGVMFVAVGLGASALTNSETQATIAGIIVFVALYVWTFIFDWFNDNVGLLSGDALLFVERFWMFYLLTDLITAISSLWESDVTSASVVAYDGGAVNPETGQVVVESQPFYLQHWFAFVILAAWIAVPLAIGYWRFERIDL